MSEAVATGSLVVAASGNDGDRGSPIGYPAALPHVTTVGATDRSGAIAAFSSRSSYVDLAAPGDDIVVASALGKNWRPSSGTSFSSPLVAGAAAWIWTARPELAAGQVAEILRRSARDLGAPGRDSAAGFGMLNVAAALALASPIRDPSEPNDDIDEVDPNGDRYLSKAPPLTTASRLAARISGRIDTYEDPRDVFRVWLPAGRSVTATLRSGTDGSLALYSAAATSVTGRFATNRLANAATKGTVERLTLPEQSSWPVGVSRGEAPVGHARRDVQPHARRSALTRSTTTAAWSTGRASSTSGFRTRTRTRASAKRSSSASASALASASRRW